MCIDFRSMLELCKVIVVVDSFHGGKILKMSKGDCGIQLNRDRTK